MDTTTASDPPAVIHIDLDGFSDICRVHGWRSPAHDSLFESGMRNALEFFAARNIVATFFTIAQDVRSPAKLSLLSEAVRGGHEIGSHSSTHRALTSLSSVDKQREIFESRDMLEQALAMEVRGFRAPGFDIDAEALAMLEHAGYQYDSSLFPNARTATRLGVDSVPCTPSAVGPAGRLLELPMPTYRALPLPFHPSYSLVLGTWYFHLGVQRARRNRAPLILLFHLTDFSDPLPGIELPNWKAHIYTLSFLSRKQKLSRCGWMLDQVQRRYQLASTTHVLKTWQLPD